MVITISLFQNRRTERALQALRDLSSPRALVIRDGARRRIPGREVVPGDLLVLSEGDRVPADATLLEESNLAADESLLTGESVPVRKEARESTAAGPPATRIRDPSIRERSSCPETPWRASIRPAPAPQSERSATPSKR